MPRHSIKGPFFMIKNLVLASLAIVFGAGETRAPVPAKSRNLNQRVTSTSRIDVNLKNWFDRVDSSPDYFSLSTKDFKTQISKLDEGAQIYLSLEKYKPKSKSFNIYKKKAVEFVSKTDSRNHPLYTYILAQLLVDGEPTNTQKIKYWAAIERDSSSFCSKKKVLRHNLKEVKYGSFDTKTFEAYLNGINSFNSEIYKRGMFDSLLSKVNKTQRAPFLAVGSDILKSQPHLVKTFTWLDKSTVKSQKGLKKRISSSTKRRRCTQARDDLIKNLGDYSRNDLKFVDQMAVNIGRCYKRYGKRTVLKYWNKMEKELSEEYGAIGREITHRNKALYLWRRNDFEEAKKEVNKVFVEVSKSKYKEQYAKNLFIYGRILENENLLSDAIDAFGKYVFLFPEGEDAQEASRFIIVLNSVLKRYDKGFDAAKKLASLEELKSKTDRDSGIYSMALFWAGRLAILDNRPDEGRIYLEKVSRLFYSTFYGSMGLYLLEKIDGQAYVLGPNKNVSFDIDKLVSGFGEVEKKSFKRSEYLIDLGLKDEIACEISEFNDGTKDEKRKIAKALYLYASGYWLDAIVQYGKLSREYRDGLPPGMERILFPKNYENYIERYTSKIGLDPDFVYAIIRQESVFNPRAKSSVGASGLMQLMPATAKMEARRLSKSYISRGEKRSLQRKIRRKTNLLEPKTNVIIGVHHVHSLLKRYRNPVYLLTSYNANPRATRRWKENISSRDILSFIERIPYQETKSYVKLVMRNYFYYKRWYGEKEEKLPLFDELLPSKQDVAGFEGGTDNNNDVSRL